MEFQNSEGFVERIPSIYIFLWFEDILFVVVILFLKLKVISEKAKIVFNIRKYLEGSTNSKEIPGHDLAPNYLKKHIYNF
jgi:hypothetical protein